MEIEMGTPRTWHTNCSLLYTEEAHHSRNNKLPLLHSQKAVPQTLLEKLQHASILTPNLQEPILPYTGEPNSELDSPISKAEVYAAITKLNTGSTTWPDGINIKVITKLNDSSIAVLTDYMNRLWD
ncbi:hypothetical protein HPB48_018261 [Haemaphysalis longicornis]|uniref:Uncharacterized protein n=1 Tax=Haemaphysalis longicornis TaxID=44386 RepID=A0A9J6G9I0_HAELO|nr:hypothetical protein HPB48_018261 [Haemaphysalis longicornis]